RRRDRAADGLRSQESARPVALPEAHPRGLRHPPRCPGPVPAGGRRGLRDAAARRAADLEFHRPDPLPGRLREGGGEGRPLMDRARTALLVALFDFGESIRSRKAIALLVLYIAGAIAATAGFIKV